MGWLQQLPSGKFHISFRFGGRKFKRSLRTKKKAEAEGILSRLEETIQLVERGRLVIPADADVGTFLLSDGKLNEKPVIEIPKVPMKLKELFDTYFASLPEGSLEESTIKGMKIHRDQLFRILNPNSKAQDLSLCDLQDFIQKRSRGKGRRGKVSATTIRRDLVTLRTIWNWGLRMGHVTGTFPNRGLIYPKDREKPPFQTWAEIERQIARGVSPQEEAELWDCLFLTLPEIDELLQHVKAVARQPFIYPFFVFAGHTGARRSEIMRSRVRDIDFEENRITIHERKKKHDRTTTRRVPMTPLLAEVLREWIANHPGGNITFVHPLYVSRCRKERNGFEPLTPSEAQDHFQRTLAGSKWEKKLRGPHVLRHSFISNCVCKGIDQRFIDSWVGHTTDEMRRRYRHLVPNIEQAALAEVFETRSSNRGTNAIL